MRKSVKFNNICPVFISDDVQKTVRFYVETLGFKFYRYQKQIL